MSTSTRSAVVTRSIASVSASSGWALFALILVLWDVVGKGDETGLIVPFSTVVQTLWDIVTGPSLTEDVLPSVARTLAGFSIAAVTGVVAGVALGWFRSLEPWFRGVLEFMRAVPPPAYVPVAILVMGADSSTRVIVIAVGAVWPVLLATTDGTRRVEIGYLDAARVYTRSIGAILRRVVLPSSLPQILAGLRISLAISLILMVVSEMISSTSGLGYKILQAQRLYDLPTMYASVLLLGVIGFLLIFGFSRIERRATVWYEGTKGRGHV